MELLTSIKLVFFPFSLFVISGCARVREKQRDLHLVASALKIHEIV